MDCGGSLWLGRLAPCTYGSGDAAYLARVYALSEFSLLYVEDIQFKCGVTWMVMADGKPDAVLASPTCEPQNWQATRRRRPCGTGWLTQRYISQRIGTLACDASYYPAGVRQ